MKNKKSTAAQEIFEKGVWYHSFEYKKIKSKGARLITQKIKELNLPDIKNKTVLDIGCSDGYFSYYFKKMFSKLKKF